MLLDLCNGLREVGQLGRAQPVWLHIRVLHPLASSGDHHRYRLVHFLPFNFGHLAAFVALRGIKESSEGAASRARAAPGRPASMQGPP